ncbi:MAG: GGDEF domain-containing protein [Desulfobacterales bacterium]|jgi:diguanylate cyclase (GGDEF)-like protein
MENEKKPSDQKRIRRQLYRLSGQSELSLDLVSALAGDRALSSRENKLFQRLSKKRGEILYVDLLFILTHQYYPEETAKLLWNQILEHKKNVSNKLGCNIGITVAALDYLGNVHNELDSPTVIREHKISQIAEIAITDGLTQLFDVSTFRAKLETEIKRYKRYGSEVSVLMIDIDDFKQFNDTHGHQKKDQILAQVASIVKKTTRDLDICSRYGGEEFSVILPQTVYRAAFNIAERIRRRIEQKFKKTLGITVSIGCAMCPEDGKSANVLVKKADNALYFSKANGKNLVTAYHDIIPCSNRRSSGWPN